MPVPDSTDIHMTDSSENSDFAEMSEVGKAGLGEQAGGFTPIHPGRLWLARGISALMNPDWATEICFDGLETHEGLEIC